MRLIIGTRLVSSFDMIGRPEDYDRFKSYAKTFYGHVWGFFWTPISVIAKFAMQFRAVRRSRFRSVGTGSLFRPLAERVHDEYFTICSNEQCETCLSLPSDEVDIDYENEIKHDLFNIPCNRKPCRPRAGLYIW